MASSLPIVLVRLLLAPVACSLLLLACGLWHHGRSMEKEPVQQVRTMPGYFVPDEVYNIGMVRSGDPYLAWLTDYMIGTTDVRTHLHLRGDGTYEAFTTPVTDDGAEKWEQGQWILEGESLHLHCESNDPHFGTAVLYWRDPYLYLPHESGREYRLLRTTRELWRQPLQPNPMDEVTAGEYRLYGFPR